MYPEYSFKSHYLKIDDNRLHYIDEGQGPVIVMVHGNPTWSYFYRNIIALLSSQYRVIAVDHMGCGLSDKPQDYPYTLSQHIDNLQRLLQSLEVYKYSMIVHDWGGAIGMGVATGYPERVEKIVILNTAAFRSKRIPLRIQICKWPIIGPLIVRGLNGFAWPATFMAIAKGALPQAIKEAYLAPYDSWANRVSISGFVQDIPLSHKHVSYDRLVEIEEKLSLIRDADIPMLILWGGKDFCFDRVFYKEWTERFPDAESHLFPEAGHYLLEDEREQVCDYLSRFFQVA